MLKNIAETGMQFVYLATVAWLLRSLIRAWRQNAKRKQRKQATEKQFQKWLMGKGGMHYPAPWLIEKAFVERDEITVMSLKKIYWREFAEEFAAQQEEEIYREALA